jgi:hypothetical protein
MIEWDAQSIERQQVILWYILKEVKKIRGLDSTTNDANTFTNPFNDNFDDLKDLGFKPNEVLHASGNQRPVANKRLYTDDRLLTSGPVFADEHVFAEEAVPADERLSAVERMSADEFINANDPSSSNSTLPSVCTLLSLPPTRSQVSYRSINYIITNLL